MNDWRSHLNTDPTNWLLGADNPSVRYYTLTDILELGREHPEVLKAKAAIQNKGIVPRILERQKQGGYWEKPEDFYIRTKYKGTVWQLIILAQLGADPQDERIKESCEFVLQWSQDRDSGGFAYTGSESGGGHHSKVLPCLSGNMLWCLLRFGYGQDPRIKKGLEFLTKYQRFDDGGAGIPKGWPYDKLEMCWGQHTCFMAVVKTLKAFLEIPPQQVTLQSKEGIHKGAEFLLKHHLIFRSHDLSRVSKPIWKKLSFPWMWNTDALEIAWILTELGYRDERMARTMELILGKQDAQGRWNLENTYNGRFQVNIERKSQTSKWITLFALKMIKAYYSLG